MPSHKIHLTIADKINKKLNKDNDSILLGSVLPDLTLSNHIDSHYQDINIDKGLTNPDEFLKEYKIDSDLKLGYLIHLLTDRFYNRYMFDNYYLFDNEGKIIGLKIDHKVKYLTYDKIRKVKHNEFDIYENKLIKAKSIPKFESTDVISKVSELNFKFDEERLKKYIIEANDPHPIVKVGKYKLCTKEELDLVFDNCIKYIFDYLEKNNIL